MAPKWTCTECMEGGGRCGKVPASAGHALSHNSLTKTLAPWTFLETCDTITHRRDRNSHNTPTEPGCSQL